jgi:hypothetical protein
LFVDWVIFIDLILLILIIGYDVLLYSPMCNSII